MGNAARTGIMIMMLLFNHNAVGYFYHVCVMKKVNKYTKQQQIVVLLGDYHDKTHPANQIQRMHLLRLLQKCAVVKGKLIVEDLSSINNDGRMICCNFGINCAQGVLGQLANKARELGIAVDNVEFRYCRVAGIGPLIVNEGADPYTIRSACGITIGSLYKEISDEIEKIKKYDDGKKLNAFYRRAICHVRDALPKMRLCADDHATTVAHYCMQLRCGEYHKELEQLCIFDSALIDSNIMHSIVSCDASVIFVVAGGSHVMQVGALLKRIGYEETLAAPLHASPQPIDISSLDAFIRIYSPQNK